MCVCAHMKMCVPSRTLKKKNRIWCEKNQLLFSTRKSFEGHVLAHEDAYGIKTKKTKFKKK
jgi:hypothetical protein